MTRAVTTLHCAPGNAGIATIADAQRRRRARPRRGSQAGSSPRSRSCRHRTRNPFGSRGCRRGSSDKASPASDLPKPPRSSKGVRRSRKRSWMPPTSRLLLRGSALTPRQVAAALDEFGPPYVVKDDGLAAGKGVVVTLDRNVALEHASHCARVVIEEYLDGPEVSLFAITDGTHGRPADTSARLQASSGRRSGTEYRRHGRLRTAALGTDDADRRHHARRPPADRRRDAATRYAVRWPALCRPRADRRRARASSSSTLASAIRKRRSCSRCCRRRWPALLNAAATGTLADHPPLTWRDGYAVTVVVAAAGYPGEPAQRRRHRRPRRRHGTGLRAARGHRNRDGQTVSTGGRVLSVTATGDTLRDRARCRLRRRRADHPRRRSLPKRHRAARRPRRNRALARATWHACRAPVRGCKANARGTRRASSGRGGVQGLRGCPHARSAPHGLLAER